MHTDVQILVYYYINLRMAVTLHTYKQTHAHRVCWFCIFNSPAARQKTQMQFRNCICLALSLSVCFWFSLFCSCFFFWACSCIVFLFAFHLYFHRSFPYGGICWFIRYLHWKQFLCKFLSYSWAGHGLFALLFSHAITVKLMCHQIWE